MFFNVRKMLYFRFIIILHILDNNDKIGKPKNYKVKDLKVYNSTEYIFENKKNYRLVFDKNELSYIYAELSFYNKQFDVDNWDVEVEFKCYEKINNINKQICHLIFTKKISKYDSIAYIREGWGSKKEGQFWKAGIYYWEAFIDGENVGNKYFYVEDPGGRNLDTNNYLQLKSGRLYEGQYDDTEPSNKTSLITFAKEQTRYIFLELNFENRYLSNNWNCEVFVKYFNEIGEIKTGTSKIRAVKKGEKTFNMTFGFGSNTKGTWLIGRYRMEVVFMNKLIAIVGFNVDNDFIEGQVNVMIPGLEPTSFIKVDTEDSSTFEELLSQINTMIGLREIKNKIAEHATYLKFLNLRKKHGFTEDESQAMYLVFTGNPGTGKTTVANKLGKLYKKMGLLSKGHIMEVDRGDLVGEFIGQTAPKVKEVIEKARGGILFIDEAYSLARAADDVKDFGREVIEILVKEMSSDKGDLAVIVAGYPREMKIFVESNPGLKSRFKYFFEFPDYLPQELNEIADFACKEKDLSLSDDAKLRLHEIIVETYRNRDKHFGNARFVYDIIEKAKINLGIRIMSENKSEYTHEELKMIKLEDILPLQVSKKFELPNIPIDYLLLNDSLNELESLLGMDLIKKQINETVELVKYYKDTNKNVLSAFYLHTVLVGNPGTGKTTVARILTKIYKSLGILERGHIVETDRQGLVAGFIGQTALKTTEKINEALGGVLFIDEAYALTSAGGMHGDYGSESIQTILKRMEDDRGKFFVFAAGYPENMDRFLKANPGLSSRFDKILRFEDYTELELYQIALKMFNDEKFSLEKQAEEWLNNYCHDLYIKRDKYFGNARTIRKFVSEVIKHQNLRMTKLKLKKKSKDLDIITLIDLQNASPQSEEVLYRRRGIGY